MVDLSGEEIKNFYVNSITENILDGFILEVDHKYPDELHDLHKDYLLAPEELEISNNKLLKYCSDIVKTYGTRIGGINKLVLNLGNKSKYVVHYRNLQLYLQAGMELTEIHRVLKFKQ